MQFIIKTIGFLLNILSYISPKLASKYALKLFSTPLKGKLSTLQSDYLKTAKQKILNYEDIKIQTYQWKGNGKTILLAHGWESNSFRWKDLIELLQAKDYNIIALDAPAHGKTGSKIFNAILYAETINVAVNYFKPEVLIGHSVGGMASVFFQNKYQNQDLKKLVLLGAPSEFTNIFKNYVNLLGYNSRLEKGLNNYVLETFGYRTSHFSTANFCKTLNLNGLIIHDTKDKIIQYKEAKMIAEKFKNSKFITTTGYGHGLRNKVVYNHVLEFIDS